MPHLITRKFEFDSGHRVLEHGSKCKYLHGHRYVALVSVSCFNLDKLGMVMDFSDIKKIIGSWIDENWDHNLILHPDDQLIAVVTSISVHGNISLEQAWKGIHGRVPYIMPSGMNPTAENMSKVLYEKSKELLRHLSYLTVERVRLFETPNCSADYEE